jgi:hypothetical protein
LSFSSSSSSDNDELIERKNENDEISEKEIKKQVTQKKVKAFREKLARDKIIRKKEYDSIPTTEIVNGVEVKISPRKRKLLILFKTIDMYKKMEADLLLSKGSNQNSNMLTENIQTPTPTSSDSSRECLNLNSKFFSPYQSPCIFKPKATFPGYNNFLSGEQDIAYSPNIEGKSKKSYILSKSDQCLLSLLPREMSPSYYVFNFVFLFITNVFLASST